MSDFYRVLGLERTASPEEVKRAYRRLARRFHPDVNPGDASAELQFKRLTEAHEVLSDPAKREEYDRFGYLRDLGQAGGGANGRHAGAAEGGMRDLFADLFL